MSAGEGGLIPQPQHVLRWHRRVGRFVFGGTVFGAVSAVAMYVLGFVL